MIEFLVISLSILLCIIGMFLSALAFSGTWLVLLASLVSCFSIDVPNLGTVIVFLLICIATEVVEGIASFTGVQKQGGSKLAGLAAVVGGLIGAAVGSAIFPIIGTIAGMLVGSFALAFFVEWHRLDHHGKAAKIAWGAVLARLIILFIKTALTLGMSLWLIADLLH